MKGPKTASLGLWGTKHTNCGGMDLSPIHVHTESQASLENRGLLRAFASGEVGERKERREGKERRERKRREREKRLDDEWGV